jgi:NADH-quinone oxidoreductase subunit E
MVPRLTEAAASAAPPDAERGVEEAVAKLGAAPEQLIGILQLVQKRFGYLPPRAIVHAATLLGMPVARVYQVGTFFKAFSLEPRGRRLVSVCLGTACHVRQAPLVLQALERALGISAGRTTADGEFTLQRVACLGACALGPVVDVDGRIHGQLTIRAAERLPAKLRKEASGGRG